MMIAAVQKDIQFLQILLEYGAEIEGDTAFRESSPLMRALQLGVHEDAWGNYEFLIQQGADVNLVYGSENGITVVERAVSYGRFGLALDLLELGYNKRLTELLSIVENRSASESEEENRDELLARLLELR